MIEASSLPPTFLEKALNHVLKTGEIDYLDRTRFLLASFSDKLLSEQELAEVRKILDRLESKRVKVVG
ncbi:MAG: hypothetical protein QNJ54_14590 [Prochloraceae cyanobacterium]|nr:hypothetical protein [Prochloraceae cyanobacterium]